MSDATALLQGLEEYYASMERHMHLMRERFVDVERTYLGLAECYAGRAADEFKPIWEDTAKRFEDYIEKSIVLQHTLAERMEKLREADRPVDFGSTGIPGII